MNPIWYTYNETFCVKLLIQKLRFLRIFILNISKKNLIKTKLIFVHIVYQICEPLYV